MTAGFKATFRHFSEASPIFLRTSVFDIFFIINTSSVGDYGRGEVQGDWDVHVAPHGLNG